MPKDYDEHDILALLSIVEKTVLHGTAFTHIHKMAMDHLHEINHALKETQAQPVEGVSPPSEPSTKATRNVVSGMPGPAEAASEIEKPKAIPSNPTIADRSKS